MACDTVDHTISLSSANTYSGQEIVIMLSCYFNASWLHIYDVVSKNFNQDDQSVKKYDKLMFNYIDNQFPVR